MKNTQMLYLVLLSTVIFSCNGPADTQESSETETTEVQERKEKSDADQDAKAREWVSSLKLADQTKEQRVEEVIATHLKTIRDWHNEHPFSTVPEGINPLNGKPLSELHRQIIANSAIPDSVHENLMAGLRKDLSEQQVETILDHYTIGKVDFTMRGYHAIVPDLTKEEEETIRGYLEEAREMAVDFKNMEQISAIFEIYKTKAEQYLNSNGRNWRQMYVDYVNKRKAEKAAQAEAESEE